jgi:hypothetical protein
VLNLAVQAFLKTLNITPMTEEEEWMLKDSDEDDDDDDDNACKYSQCDGTSTGRVISQSRFGQTVMKLRSISKASTFLPVAQGIPLLLRI